MISNDSFELCFVGDRSGSMISMGDSPWQGARDWANEQAGNAKKNGDDAYITLVTFDEESERPLNSVPTNNWENVTDQNAKKWMKPRGTTRLYDTAIEELQALKSRMTARGSTCKGIFALLTDGCDNCSQSSPDDMNKVVTKARNDGITCFFLAANQDAIASGARYGFIEDQCLLTGADQETSINAFKAMNSAYTRAISGQASPAFTQLERTESAPPPYKE